MKLKATQIKKLSAVTEQDAKVIIEAYSGAVIADIKYTSPRCNPLNKQVYATIKNSSNETIVSATLDFCVERMSEVAFLQSKFKKTIKT